MLLSVPVLHAHPGAVDRGEGPLQPLGDHHRAVAAAGAADGDVR